jgi:UDP-glucuronate 4-epimerase
MQDLHGKYVLVTGAAGFIGSAVSAQLLARGARVLGVDNMNAYYEVTLKEARLARLTGTPGFDFAKVDISDREGIFALTERAKGLTHVIHLAAQAGVRYSLIDPYAYVTSNVMGHVVMCEFAKSIPTIEHFVYASSSSVYGANKELPFSVEERVDQPDSLYAATKRADELLSRTYAHLWKLPSTGLRFFTVYGPWGRPDMAAFIFTKAIFEGRKITVFNNGEMWRDFTYIDDIVAGVLGVMVKPPLDVTPPAKVYNLGNHSSEKLTRFVEILEGATNRKAEIEFAPLQPGDVPSTYADIEASTRDFGFEPKTSIDVGLPQFVDWYRKYYGV